MVHALGTAALVAATTAGFPPSLAVAPGAPPAAAGVLAVMAARVSERPAAGTRRAEASASPCVGDMCPPRVTIPGYEHRYVRPSRTELAIHYLDRASLGPVSTIARGLLVSGLRLDYSPPMLESASAVPTRWGTVFVRVRFRIDAENVPVIPRGPGR